METTRRQQIISRITDISSPKKAFYFMLCLSVVIAAYGLLSNSTAVVIGAMLVAPLMGPIFGIALSLSIDDRKLLFESVFAELSGIVLALLIAVVIGIVPLRPEYGSEIIARTTPTLYDILIAFASGLAGAYAMVDERISAALAGVAIATALVPPLATCGLCIAIGNWTLALGAFSLFFVNLVSIELAAALVFLLTGVATIQQDITTKKSLLFKRFVPRLVVFAGLAVFMTITLKNVIETRQFQARLRNELSGEISTVFGARLLDFQYDKSGQKTEIVADVVTPKEFTPAKVQQIESNLQKKINPDVNLVIRSLVSRSASKTGPVFLQDAEIKAIEENRQRRRFTDTVTKIVYESLKQHPGAQLDDILQDTSSGKDIVWVMVRTPKEIPPSSVAYIESEIRKNLNRDISLIVRSTITRDADASKFLYEEEVVPDPAIVAWEEMHTKIERVLKENLPRLVPGASLISCLHEEKDGHLEITVEVITPKVFKTEQVRSLEKQLKKILAREAELTIRSTIGRITTSAPDIKKPVAPKTMPGKNPAKIQ